MMCSNGSRMPFAVPRLRGCTMTFARSAGVSAGCHQRRCCSATIVQMRCGAATTAARSSALRSSEGPPFKEQNCFGTGTPDSLVVS